MNEYKRQRLAEAARDEVAEHIRNYPGKWIEEIADSIPDAHAFVEECLEEYARKRTVSDRFAKLVDDFAESAGESAYRGIINHPGVIL